MWHSEPQDPAPDMLDPPDPYMMNMNTPVLRIRIRRIRMFLALLDPDPLVRGMDPDPSIIKQK
jgi:hypothetical protein